MTLERYIISQMHLFVIRKSYFSPFIVKFEHNFGSWKTFSR